MVSPAKTRTSGFSSLQDAAPEPLYNKSASRVAIKYATDTTMDKRRLERIVGRVKQALEPFYRSSDMLADGVPATDAIRAFLEETNSRSNRAIELHTFRKCLYALGIASADTAFVLDAIDQQRTGVMDRRAFAATFLPARLHAGPSGVRRRFPGASRSDDADTDKDMDAFHRTVVERVLVKYASVQDAFRQYDTNRAGVLSIPQFRVFLRDVGFVGADVDALIQHLDRNGERAIPYRAFAQPRQSPIVKYSTSKPSPKRTAVVPLVSETDDPIERIRTKLRQRVIGRNKSIREVFMEFDADGNGHLDHDEFAQFMAAYDFTPDETKRTIAFLDRDGSGTIDYDEFASGLLFYRPTAARPLQTDAERDAAHGAYLLSIVREKLAANAVDVRQLQHEFRRFDADNSGALDYTEFSAFLVGLGIKLSPRDLATLMHVVDKDRSLQIEFAEFTAIFGDASSGLATRMLEDHATLVDAFRHFDTDNSGDLEADEFRQLMRRYGLHDDREITQLIAQLDCDRSGTISLDEFLAHFEATASSGDSPSKPTISPPKVYAKPRDTAALRELKQVWVDEVLERHGSLDAAFSEHDRLDRGAVEYDQVRDLLGQYGVSDDRNVRALLRQLDSDNVGTVSRDAFLQVFGAFAKKQQKKKPTNQPRAQQQQQQRRPNDLAATQAATTAARLRLLEEQWIVKALETHGSVRAAFDAFDADGNGNLDHEEFRSLLAAYGITRDDDVATMIRRLDIDGSGTIEYDEFATLFHDRRVPAVHRPSPQRASLAPLASETNTNKANGARLHALELKWIQRALSCHATIDAAFDEYDRDGNGSLDYDEFSHCMKRYGITQDDDIARLVRRLDLDGSGTIDKHEFSTVFHPLRCKTSVSFTPMDQQHDPLDETEELETVLEIERELASRIMQHTRDLRQAFRKFDLNGNGRLEYTEFRRVLKGYKFPEPEIRKVIRHLDRDVSGFIDYREFIAGLAVDNTGSAKKSRASKRKTKPKTTASVLDSFLERLVATHGAVQSAFRQYDTARAGVLDRRQVETMVLDLGFSRDDARLVCDCLDTDASGTIEYEEFVTGLAPSHR